MTLDELRERAAGSIDPLWWTYRFLDEVMSLRDGATAADRAAAVDGFLRLATHDPEWAAKVLSEGGSQGHLMAMLLSAESALSRLHLPTIKDDAMLRARMLCTSARWQRDSGGEELLHQAWAEMLRIPEDERDGAWHALALMPTAVADYPRYRELAITKLASLDDGFWRSSFLASALPVASRHRDWPTFDAWLGAWTSLPAPLTRGHHGCMVINLEGLRALDDGRPADAEVAMRRLLEAAAGVQFLSNEDTSALPRRLRAEGLLLDLCDSFDAMVKRLDWRLLAK
jgi:hypothetical protein